MRGAEVSEVMEQLAMTIQEFVKQAGLTMECQNNGTRIEETDNGRGGKMKLEQDAWLCTLKRGTETYAVPFFMGLGHRKLTGSWSEHDRREIMTQKTVWAQEKYKECAKPVPPTAEDVLDCLASDAAGYDNSRSFEDWAGDYGYDPDSRKEAIYHAVAETSKRLRSLLGAELYETLLWQVERL